jgi:hypothetical protein
MTRLLAFAILLLANTLAIAQKMPPRAYESWGVCPFECCTYREWTANEEIPVHRERNEKSPVVFTLHHGQAVDGVTGVVVAEKPGVVKSDKPVRDGYIKGSDAPQLSLRPGDEVYMLSPLGEGSYLFWYQGKVYQSGNALAAMPGVDAREAKMVWWKQVRNKSGKSGWTLSNKFANVDACG